jgi:hypothetical protein
MTGGFIMGFRTSITVVFGLAVLTLSLVRAQSEGRTITITTKAASSSFFNANFSFDGKGQANSAIYSGVGSMGKFTGEGMSQSAYDGNTCVLDGLPGHELKLVGHFASTKYERTGDLLFERGRPGDLVSCLLDTLPPTDPKYLTFVEDGTVLIVGGTGAFAGAHGFEVVHQRGQIKAVGVGLNPDLTVGFAAFGSSQGTFTPTFKVREK